MRSHLTVALLLLAAATTSAQDPVATRPTAPPVPVLVDSSEVVVTQQGGPQDPSCWRARRSCKTFFLTDFGFQYAAFSTRHADPAEPGGKSRDFGGRLIWTMGLMSGRGRQSHGAAVSVVTEDMYGGVPLIVEYRYRNWASESIALDAGVGFKRTGFADPVLGNLKGKGITTLVGFTPSRWIGVDMRFEIVRAAGRDRRALFLGVESTRLSEEAFKLVFVTALNALLEKIGVDTSNEDQ